MIVCQHGARIPLRQIAVMLCLLFVFVYIVVDIESLSPYTAPTPTAPPTTVTPNHTTSTERTSTESSNASEIDWITPLQFLRQPKEGICRNISFFAMVRIKATDFNFRETWRKTFGSFAKEYNFSYAFLLSLPPDAATQIMIESEIEKYNDILECNHIDAYMNVTYKTLASLKYFSEACDDNVVMVKIDDDIFFNFSVFQEFVPKFKARPEGFMCSIIKNNCPSRDNNSIWYVPREQFSKEVYPAYCDGSFFWIKQRTAKKIIEVLPRSTFLWVDDVFVTGVLREMVKAGIVSWRELFDKPYIQSSQNNAFAYFARTYPQRLCKNDSTSEDCVSITTELGPIRPLGPKRKR